MSDINALLAINVNENTEKKNGLTYLSWAWAWTEVLKIDQQATWEAVEYPTPVFGEHGGQMCAMVPAMMLPDGSAMVKTKVTIKGDTKTCMLPVMNHRNQAIKNPDAFQINTAIMRCMTKTISMHGLGLYIYAGEDLPVGDSNAESEPAPIKHKPTDGSIVPPERMAVLDDTAEAIKEAFGRDSVIDAYGYACDITDPEEKTKLWSMLSPPIRSALKKHGQSLREAA